MEDRAQLVAVEALDERRREADAWTKEPVAERERSIVHDDVDAPLEHETLRGRGNSVGKHHLARHERSDERRRRGELAEERPEPERDPAERKEDDESRDDVGRVLRAPREQLLDARREREKEGDQDRARGEREAEKDRERAISAFHECPSARDAAARRDASHRRYPARP